MGLDTYCYLIFYGLTLIHLTDPLSQVVQIMCVMRICISEKKEIALSLAPSLSLLFLWLERARTTHLD